MQDLFCNSWENERNGEHNCNWNAIIFRKRGFMGALKYFRVPTKEYFPQKPSNS